MYLRVLGLVLVTTVVVTQVAADGHGADMCTDTACDTDLQCNGGSVCRNSKCCAQIVPGEGGDTNAESCKLIPDCANNCPTGTCETKPDTKTYCCGTAGPMVFPPPDCKAMTGEVCSASCTTCLSNQQREMKLCCDTTTLIHDKCPAVPEGVFGTCDEACPPTGCPTGQKCCSNGCGHVCKPAINAANVPNHECKPTDNCDSCASSDMCVSNSNVKFCCTMKSPTTTNPDNSCPAVPEGVMGICPETCPPAGCPTGQKCCSNGCGHACMPDMAMCTDVMALINATMSNTECMDHFGTAVATGNTKELYCSNFWAGLECLAEKIAPGYSEECLKRMAKLIIRNPAFIIEAIRLAGRQIEAPFAAESDECSENPLNPVFPDEGCPAIPDGVMGTCAQCPADGCSTSEKCCFNGCGHTCMPDLSICVDVPQLMSKALENFDCLTSFTIAVADGVNYEDYCSNFWSGLDCLAKVVGGDYSTQCLHRMAGLIQKTPAVIIQTIKSAGIPGIDDTHASMSAQCPENPLGNLPVPGKCPLIMSDEAGICPQECTDDSGCSAAGESCCPTNCGGHICSPDITMCSSISDTVQLVGTNAEASKCRVHFEDAVSADHKYDFCRDFWKGIKCLAKVIGKGKRHDFSELCEKKMATVIQGNPAALFTNIRTYFDDFGSSSYESQAGMCDENPLSQDSSTRPVGEELKQCATPGQIQKVLSGCNPPRTSILYTQQGCSDFKRMVVCIAGKLFPNDRDPHMRSQCQTIIMELIEDRGKLLSTWLSGFKPSRCLEQASVCGADDYPMDNILCHTTRCPASYRCVSNYCCKERREGMCPEKPRGTPLCTDRCNHDGDCEVDSKCCHQGCSHKTCAKLEMKPKSACEREFYGFKERLELDGICGDGKSTLNIARCQNTGYLPSQPVDFLNGIMMCVEENGSKIPGSEHIGNMDCTKVKPGKCPAMPSECSGIANIQGVCRNDEDCNRGQKCCVSLLGESCVKKCKTALPVNTAPQIACPNGQERSCCSPAVCLGKICQADHTAVCRINSCGGCTADFYNKDNMKVNCSKGITKCMRDREMARMKNSEMMRSDDDRLRGLADSNAPEGEDHNDRDSIFDDDNSDDNDDDDDDDMDRMDRSALDGLENDTRFDHEDDDDDSMDEMNSRMDSKSDICVWMAKNGVCKNGGKCVIGMEEQESDWQICQCPEGNYGLFCGMQGAKPATLCQRDQMRVTTIYQTLKTYTKEARYLQEIFVNSKIRYSILPKFQCDDIKGSFKTVQMGMFVPLMSPEMIIKYCVYSHSGKRIANTPVTFTMSGMEPNCVARTQVDILKLPKKCMAMKMYDYEADSKAEWFYDNSDTMCKQGKATGYGFLTATACYDMCGLYMYGKPMCPMVAEGDVGICQEVCSDDEPCVDEQMCCSNGCGHVCKDPVHVTPSPCQAQNCDYEWEFCLVNETDMTGQCQRFQSHCDLKYDEGFGDKHMGAYYFNGMTRRCEKFLYKGQGGNRNRFYHLEECWNSCAAREYKNDAIVCPHIRVLMVTNPAMSSDCDDDFDCKEDGVCCSNGHARVCTAPIQSCLSGERCSLDGTCVDNKCMCNDDCTSVAMAKVCGSDGKTYDNTCHMKFAACKSMTNITVVSDGMCPDACKMPCTEEYTPFCVLDVTNPDQGRKIQTYSNECEMKADSLCNKKRLLKLYDGECRIGACAAKTCGIYESCNQETSICFCADACTMDYSPVCGRPLNGDGMPKEFSNHCALEVYGCQNNIIYVNIKEGMCKDQPDACDMACTKEYQPMCAYDTTTQGEYHTVTFSNYCLLNVARNCELRKLHTLNMGMCKDRTCGSTTCDIQKDCVENQCVCMTGCPRNYEPVCAYPVNDMTDKKTFSNLCEMRNAGCMKGEIYAVYKKGPCVKIEPKYECPETRANIPYSAENKCHPGTHAYCNKDTQMCCPYGATHRCLSKKYLVRQRVTKDGLCPMQNLLTFDKTKCLSDKCEDDSDCAGDAKCCTNDVCGHMACSPPLLKSDSQVCPSGQTHVKDLICDPASTTNMCVTGFTCTSVTRGDQTIGVCCGSASTTVSQEDVQKTMLCNALMPLGIMCQNGGSCLGDIKNKQMCQCQEGYTGAFCETISPSITDDGCPAVPDGAVGSCVEECIPGGCPTGTKCCSNGCGHVCKPDVCNKRGSSGICGGIAGFQCNPGTTCTDDGLPVFPDKADRCCIDEIKNPSECLRFQAIYGYIFMKFEERADMAMDMMNDNDRPARKRRDDHSDEEEEDTDCDMCNGDGDMSDMDGKDIAMEKFYHALMNMGIYNLPSDGEVYCTEDGGFDRTQCVTYLKTHEEVCLCFGDNDKPVPNGPKGKTRSSIDCSVTKPGFPQFCLETPDMEQACDGQETERYFFNSSTSTCEKFMDCQFDTRNSFDSKETCDTECFSFDVQSGDQCAGVRCPLGGCVVRDGQAVCEDYRDQPKGGMGMFEPQCEADGMFAKKQCHGNVCKCVNPDTGAAVPNSVASGRGMMCNEDSTVKKPENPRKCKKGTDSEAEPEFCAEGGDPCKNCEKQTTPRDNSHQRSGQQASDQNGVCTNCETCSASQAGKVCKDQCSESSVCKQFPEAICKINKCTCEEQFTANGRVIKCSQVQSLCERQKDKMEKEERAKSFKNNNADSPSVKLLCDEQGTFHAMCMDNSCYCLNATNGQRYGQAKVGATPDNIDCSTEKLKTKIVRAILRFKVSGRSLESISDIKLSQMKSALKKEIEARIEGVTAIVEFVSGSIIAKVQLESENLDLNAVKVAIDEEVQNGGLTFTAGGETFTPEGNVEAQLLTAEEIESPTTDKPDDKDNDKKKTVMIIVIVVVVVVVLVAVGIGIKCYCSKKKSGKQYDTEFTNIQSPTYDNKPQGHMNPTYK